MEIITNYEAPHYSVYILHVNNEPKYKIIGLGYMFGSVGAQGRSITKTEGALLVAVQRDAVPCSLHMFR
jgi:hypothetical protein